MTARTAETSPVIYARVAAFLYLLTVPLGIFGVLYVPSLLIVRGDAATTAKNLVASEPLFRLAIVSNLLAPIVLLLGALILYKLLVPVNKSMALLMVILLVVGVPIGMLNELTYLAALQVLSGTAYLQVFPTGQLQALAYLFLRLHTLASTIAFIFWGLWLFPLGYLVLRSGFIPGILGILLMIACIGYVMNSFATFLGYDVSIGMFAALGELAFIFWLLIKGVNAEQWKKRAAESA